MRARGASSGLAWLWVAILGTSAASADDCVIACIESAVDGFVGCRERGGTVEECSEAAGAELARCGGDRGCQGVCADTCLAETSSVYARCLDDGASEDDCALVASQAAESCYAACPTDCELRCTFSTVIACLSEADPAVDSVEDCRALGVDGPALCAECEDPGDADGDGIPNEFDRCGLSPRITCGTADAGGPYITSPATGIQLDGSASSLPGGTIVEYSWDWNGDGVFGDATGVRPASVGLVHFLGIERTVIGLRVTDDRGLSDTAFAEFTLSERSFSVDDVETVEGDGEVSLTVRLSRPIDHPVTVDYLTRDGAPVKGTLGKPFTWENCGIFRILDLYQRGLLVHADATPPHEGGFPAWPHPGNLYGLGECLLYHWHHEEIDDLEACGHSFIYQPDLHPHAATAGEDYVPASGTLRFAPGQTEAEISVRIIGDAAFEPDETFQVFLRNPSIGSLVDGVGVVTILSDGDTRPEDCADGVDNNGDGLVDCDDPACATSPSCPQALRAFVRCDATGDGVHNVSDAVHMVSELFLGAPETLCRETTDCNGDTIRDISDVVYSLAFSFGAGTAPPQPFPSCGTATAGMGVGASVDCEVYEACAPGFGAPSRRPLVDSN